MFFLHVVTGGRRSSGAELRKAGRRGLPRQQQGRSRLGGDDMAPGAAAFALSGLLLAEGITILVCPPNQSVRRAGGCVPRLAAIEQAGAAGSRPSNSVRKAVVGGTAGTARRLPGNDKQKVAAGAGAGMQEGAYTDDDAPTRQRRGSRNPTTWMIEPAGCPPAARRRRTTYRQEERIVVPTCPGWIASPVTEASPSQATCCTGSALDRRRRKVARKGSSHPVRCRHRSLSYLTHGTRLRGAGGTRALQPQCRTAAYRPRKDGREPLVLDAQANLLGSLPEARQEPHRGEDRRSAHWRGKREREERTRVRARLCCVRICNRRGFGREGEEKGPATND